MARVENRGAAWLKLALLVAIVLAALLAARYTALGDVLSREGIGRVIAWLRDAPAAPVVFIAAYAFATAVAIPGTILTLAGGALFGPLWGTVYNSVAANLGANAAFGVARFLGRDAVERVTGDRLSKLDRASREHGFRGLLTLRLIPLVPFNALNFGSGLTAMSWGSYAAATAIGILPGTIVYTVFADALLVGSQEASREAFIRVAVSGAALILLSFLPTILKKLDIDLPGRATGLLALLALPAILGTTTPSVHAQRPDTPAGAVEEAPLVDPAPFARVLDAHRVGGRVDYAALQDDRADLDRYLEALATVDPGAVEGASRNDRLAFWINAYNACMLRLVVDHYPIEPSSGGLFGAITGIFADRPDNSVWQIDDVFTRDHCEVAGSDRSQDEIEHEIIRPMGEPRIHFAVNCAAISCPVLAAEPYRGARLDAQLDRQVDAFVANEEHFRVQPGDEATLRLNRVLDWYSDDFGGEDALPAFFEPYVDAELRTILRDPDLDVDFFDYDWRLNDVRIEE